MYTKQDLIEELEVQRDYADYADSVEQWEEINYQIVQLQQELDIESMIDHNAISCLLRDFC